MFVICPKCASKYRIPTEITLKKGQKVQCSACRHIFNFKQEKEEELNESPEFSLQVPEDPVLVSEKTTIKEEKILYSNELPEVFHPLKPMPTKTNYMWSWILICLGILVILIFCTWMYRDTLKTDYTNVHQLRRIQFPTQNAQNEKVKAPSQYNDKKDPPVDIPFYFSDDDKIITENANLPIHSLDFHFHSVRFRYEANALLIEGIIRNDSDISQSLPNIIYATGYNYKGDMLFQKEIFLENEVIAPYGQKAFFSTYSPAPNGVQWIEVSCKK